MQRIAIGYFIEIVADLEEGNDLQMNESSIAADIIMTQLRRVIGPVFSEKPFSSSRSKQLGPDRLSNLIGTM